MSNYVRQIRNWLLDRRDAEDNGDCINVLAARNGRRYYELSHGLTVFSWGLGINIDRTGAVLTLGPAWFALTIQRWAGR